MAKRKRQRITGVGNGQLAEQDTASIIIWQEAKVSPAPVDEGEEFTGREWEVTIIGAKALDDVVVIEGEEFIRSSNNRLYHVAKLEEAVPQFEGIKVYDNHLTQEEFREKGGMRSAVGEWLGTIVRPFWDGATKSIKGFFKVVEDSLATKLKSAWEQGVLPTIGLSIDTHPIINRQVTFENERMPIIEGFNKILSVDLVAEPAAGGSLDRIMASRINTEVNFTEDNVMDKEQIAQLVTDTVVQVVPGVVQAVLEEALTTETQEADDAEVQATPVQEPVASEPVAPQGQPAESDEVEESDEAESDDTAAQITAATEGATRAEESVKQLHCRLAVSEALRAAKLSENGQAIVRQAFPEGRIFKTKELDALIITVKKGDAEQDPSGRVTESGGLRQPRVQVGLDDKDKVEIEFMRLAMGDRSFQSLADKDEEFVKVRMGESTAYQDWIKGGKQNTGHYRRMSQLIYDFLGGDPLLDDIDYQEASTLATVTKNTVNILIALDYSLQQRWYEDIVTPEEVDTIDDTTLARFFGVSELSVVEKGAPYTELSQSDEEETASFVKKGNVIAVPFEDLMKDKLNYFRTIPRRLADTWYNTLSQLTARVFTTNSNTGPTLSDTGALFNATVTTTVGGHANLLTAALSFTSYGAARTAMRKQTNEPLGVGRKILMQPRFLLVPEDLETTAIQIRNSEQIPGSANNDVNPHFGKFDIIVVPDWTDTNDFALVADPKMFPQIYHIFPRGGATPQLFTADNPVAGTMFTNDTLRFKVRMLTYEFSSTFPCAPVADFRGLHKSNV